MKKLLDDGLDLLWWPRGGKKRCERTEQPFLQANMSVPMPFKSFSGSI
jgi:hypothetical protein